SLLLPAISLSVVQAAILARVTRSAVLEVLREDFVRTARAKGLSKRDVLWRHVLRNAMIPVMTVMGLQFANLLAGTIVIENVFYRRALRHRSCVTGGTLSLMVLCAALLSLVWTPWSAYEIDVASKLRPPSAVHWLGTDVLGRDIVSLLLVGARSTIMVGIIAVGIGLTFGVCLGLIASARKGWTEELIMRMSDFTFAFPAVLSAIMLAAVVGPGMV